MKPNIEIHPDFKKYENEVHKLILQYEPQINEVRYLQKFNIIIDKVTRKEFYLLNGDHWNISTMDRYCTIRIYFIHDIKINILLNELEKGLKEATV